MPKKKKEGEKKEGKEKKSRAEATAPARIWDLQAIF